MDVLFLSRHVHEETIQTQSCYPEEEMKKIMRKKNIKTTDVWKLGTSWNSMCELERIA